MAMQRRGEEQARSAVLLIEQDAAAAGLLVQTLVEHFGTTLRIATAADGRGALDLLRNRAFDLVLADLLSLADLDPQPEGAMARLVRVTEGALVIALSQDSSVSSAVGTMRAGAHDVVAKSIDGAVLAARLRELAHRHRAHPGLAMAPAQPNAVADFAGFIGASSAMQAVYDQIARVAASSAPVFITGESGTGKDVCAEALHAKGPRANRPLIAINCAAIPRDLMESELFGVARGAFTGAHEDRKGAAELADGGTLFLDEVGEMDLSLQSKLLRFLQTGTLSRVGEAQVRQVDVRVICATNRNPMHLIAERKFREDLFYRLHVLPIHLPPLRQRASDVMVLANAFLRRFAHEEHKLFSGFAPEAAVQMAGADWPGNVRQLQNLVRRLVVMFDGGTIDAAMVSAADIEGQARPRDPALPVAAERRAILPMWRQEQQIIEDAIKRFGGNISLAAAALEISPSTIYRKRQGWAEAAAS